MTTPIRRRAALLLLATSGLTLAVAWAFASPVGASPDEAAHINYAWGTVTGQTIVGEHLVTIQDGRTATQVRIPNKLLQYPDPVCYMFHAGTPTAACSPIPADNRQLVTQASYMSRYPPLFYSVEGVALYAATAADLSGPVVLYGARLVAAGLSLLAVGYGLFLLSRRFADGVVLLASLLALPAMWWFLAASVNPNGLEIAAAFLLAAGVLSVRVDDAVGVRSGAAVLAVPIGTALLAYSRPLSWVWASLILGMLLVPTHQSTGGPWTRRMPLRKIGVVVGAATVLVLASAIWWFVYALQIRALESAGQTDRTPWTGLKAVGGIILLLLHSGQIVSEQIGIFGWLDTPLPSLALLSWVAIGGVAIAIWVAGRNYLVPRWSVVALLVLGNLAAMLDEFVGTWGWQGRYLLPVTAAAWVFALPGLTKGLGRLPALMRAVPWIQAVLMAVNALAVVWFLFRNVYGIKRVGLRLPPAPFPLGPPLWIPPLGQGIVLVLVGVMLVCGVIALWMLRPLPAHREGQSSHESLGIAIESHEDEAINK